ncbi:MAG: 3,4-dihydroxy-2-butanone 4-phosphate synthase [Pseudomonadota bacterium]|jgi:3,4-dihydroxy 2-butanone 4-phosphate synthase/GTP cyclohydrolase II
MSENIHNFNSSSIAPIESIIQDIKQGKMVVLIDEEDRENEGDIVIASEFVTPEIINFMATHARGLICLTLTEQRCKQLNLGLMVQPHGNGTQHGTNFTLSIEAAEGVTTGISAADRAKTVQAAVARNAKPNDIVQPGHIFPLKAVKGGVLMRAGHTEAACDLADLAGLEPSGVICEIMNEDGTMSRLPDLIPFAQKHGLNIGTISSLIQYRSQTESIINIVHEKELETPYGTFKSILYNDIASGHTHIALINGNPTKDTETLVRVHEPLSFYDFLSVNSRHSWSLHQSMKILADSNKPSVLILMNCEENSQNFVKEFTGEIHSPKKADLRTYGVGAQILKNIGVGKMRLLANPMRIPSMAGYGLEIVGYYS